MGALLVLVASAALGIEAGWQPLPDGGHEYTIQFEPELLDILKRGGEEVFSEVPADLQVRRYRIIVGKGKLPRDAGTPPHADPRAAVAPANQPLASQSRNAQPYGATNQPEHSSALDYAPEPAAPPAMAARGKSPRQVPPAESTQELDLGAPPAASPEHAPAEAPHHDTAAASVDDGWNLDPAARATPDLDTTKMVPVDRSAQHDLSTQHDPGAGTEHAHESEGQAAGDHALHDKSKSQAANKGEHTLASPGKLPPGGDSSRLIPAAFGDKPSGEVDTQKPTLPNNVNRPWPMLVGAVVLLAGSIGANIYLGWLAWDARARYRDAVAKYRAAPAS